MTRKVSAKTPLPIVDSWRTLFAINPQATALFRIAIGLIILADLLLRIPDIAAMYSDDGMFPRAEILRRSTTIWNWSFHFASGSAEFQMILFCVAALFATALLVGFETKLATIGSWLLLISLHHRTPTVLSGADVLLRALLFWGMFLPLGSVWSIDARRRPSNHNAAPALSIASAAILLQVAIMYLFSGILKFNSDWLSGQAIAGILSHDAFASAHASHLLKFPTALKLMTWATLVLELAGPILLFTPFRNGRLRIIVVAALAAMHLGIYLWMEVDLFPFVSLAGLILFLPREFFERLGSKIDFIAPSRNTPRLHPIAQGLCLTFVVYIFAVNISELPRHPLAPLSPEKWRPFSTALGLGQRWGMFEAIPSNDGWYVARARLKDGSEVDLLRDGAAVNWNRPPFPAGIYPNFRWRKVFREISYFDEQGFQYFRAPVGEFLVRRWNSSRPPEKQVAEFELVFCAEDESKGKAKVAPVALRQRHLRMNFGDL